jgi:hypothetical protein
MAAQQILYEMGIGLFLCAAVIARRNRCDDRPQLAPHRPVAGRRRRGAAA